VAETGDPFPPIVDDDDFGSALQPAAQNESAARSWRPRVLGGRK